MVFWIFVVATCALSIAADVRWHEKALQAAEQGLLLPLKRSGIRFIILAILLVLLVLSLFLQGSAIFFFLANCCNDAVEKHSCPDKAK